MGNLEQYLDKPAKDLVAALPLELTDAEQERHRIYSLLLMAITRSYWNGNKFGHGGAYPLNPSEAQGDIGNYFSNDYLGHNIAALAVDGDGSVIDFDFNHNEVFNSSAEHAEARLVRRLFSLVQVDDSWNVNGAQFKAKNYANLLTSVSIYTTLESCSQCSGIMALGAVKEIIYLQRDPGMYFIGNILRRLTVGTSLPAPLPISGDAIGLAEFDRLNEEFKAFAEQQASETGKAFFDSTGGHARYSDSLTSFLCTRAAYSVYVAGEKAFDAMNEASLTSPNFKPTDRALTNKKALDEAKDFREYATRKARRGTPHK